MTTERVESSRIDLRDLKERVSRTLPPNNAVRELILGEDDFVPRGEYLVKAESWARLLRAQEVEFAWVEAVHRGQSEVAVQIETHRIDAVNQTRKGRIAQGGG